MPVIIAFDPGETTGIAVVQWSKKLGVAKPRYAFERDSAGLKQWLHLMQRSDVRYPEITSSGVARVTIVCEQFRLYPWKGKAKSWSDLPEVLNQGAIEYVAYALGCKMNYQTPAAMKALFPEKGRLRLELAVHSIPSHARDALCHALLWIIKQGKLPTIPKLDWDGWRGER